MKQFSIILLSSLLIISCGGGGGYDPFGGGADAAPLIMDKHEPGWGWVGNYYEWNADTAWGITNRGWMYAFRHPGATP